MQGTCTSPPTGSQVSPRWCSIAISAAISTWPSEPPSTWHKPGGRHRAGDADLGLAAAQGRRERRALLEQAADLAGREQEVLDARFGPVAESSRDTCSTAGTTPAAPLVGAVTTRPKAAFSSLTARAKQLTHLSVSRNPPAPCANRRVPIFERVEPPAAEQRLADLRRPPDDAERPGQDALGPAAAEDALPHRPPDGPQPGADLVGGAPGQLVAPDDLGDREIVDRGSGGAGRRPCRSASASRTARRASSCSPSCTTKPPPIE